MKMLRIEGKGLTRILAWAVALQVVFSGLPLNILAADSSHSNLRQISSLNRIATDIADGGLVQFEIVSDPRQILLDEIKKEIAEPGTGKIPRLALFSDPHADIKRTDALLADMLNKLIGFEGELEKFTSIEKQLNAQGLSLQDIKKQDVMIVLNGDLLDRGKEGIECFFRFQELVEAGVAHWNLGNHDLWMTANLMKFHLPYYEGYNFYGDSEAEALIAGYRQSNPEYFDSDEAAYQWAAWLAEYNEMQEKFQKDAKLSLNGKELSAQDVREHFLKEVYEKYSSQWNTQQLDAMEDFIGHFARIKVPDPYVGLNGLGKTSSVWWQELHNRLVKGHEARRNAGADEAELSQWQTAMALANSIAPAVEYRLHDAEKEGKWWYRIFESINNQAYASVEWWAKDWSSHKGWGEEAIKELNKLIKEGVIAYESETEFNQANYLQSKTFQAIAEFYQANANLYYKDRPGNLISHGWFPVNEEGEISITYQGVNYAGRDLFKGLDAIAADIKDENTPIADKWEALNLINEWYADATTTLKSNNVEEYIKTFGVAVLNSQMGVVNWFTGHNPINKFNIPAMNEQAGYRHFEIDDGMGKKFGGLGFWVDVSSNGILMRGYESEESREIVNNPATPILDKKTKSVKRIIENPGVSRTDFLVSLRDHLQNEIRLAEVDAVRLHTISEFERSELEGMTVLLRIDVNVLKDSGEIKSEKRLETILDTITYLIDNGATVIALSHNGRPKGKVLDGLKQEIVARRMQELLAEKGSRAQVVFHSESITDKGLKEDLDLEIEAGKVNFLENTRFFTGEEKNYASFAKALAGLADIFGFDAFGTAERIHASTAGAARYLQSVFTGFLMEKEDKYLEEALKNIHGIIMGGGPKMKEKLPVIKNVINNLPQKEGWVALGSATGNAALKARHGIETAVEVSEENVQGFKTFDGISSAREVTVLEPVDYIVCDMDIFQKKPGTENTYADLKELPEKAVTFIVTLDQLKKGEAEVSGRTFSTRDMYLLDIGPATAALYDKYIKDTPEGRSVFQNGAVGVDEIKAFAEGQNAVWQSMADATLQGVITVAGGGDTIKSAEKAKVIVKGKEMTADKAITHASTGGGASAARLQGKTNEAIQALKERQADRNRVLQSLRSGPEEFQRFLVGERRIFNAQGGEFFKQFVTAIKKDVRSRESKDGDLSAAVWSAKVIKDSRGRDTVRAGIKIGDREVFGEVPAGASTGEDEANTVSIDEALANVQKIGEMLSRANLDLSKFDDLVQAENMIREAAGKNFVNLGANATVPVSWALWKMAAALNDMTLKEYVRWNYAGVLSRKEKYAPVRFYMNIYNGGLHAVKEGEALGKDRIDIQEIMIVPYADSYAEALAMGDRIDLELKNILEARFPAENINRADEAGFSVKGLGDSSEAIGYVIQAIENAGYIPGEDVKLALDAAAASFYNREKKLYEFMGEDMTSEDMIRYYKGLAEEYKEVFLSIEDGLDENDWEGWKKFTETMTGEDILTIGDDLYVTQMGRFSKGNDEKAATAILIKVNQNGSVLGTLEVMTEAIEREVEYVVSHRSGETLAADIADLAEAFSALGLKTGDPQPEHAGYAEDELVRRAKYERMVELENEDPYLGGKALVVSQEFFKMGGVTDAARYILNKMDKELKIVVYGNTAEDVKAVLGEQAVLTAVDLKEADEMLDVLGFTSDNRVVIQSAKEPTSPGDRDAMRFLKVIRINDLPMLALAKALDNLFPKESFETFAEYFSQLEDKGILSRESAEQYGDLFLNDQLMFGEAMAVTDLKVETSVNREVAQERKQTVVFMTKI